MYTCLCLPAPQSLRGKLGSMCPQSWECSLWARVSPVGALKTRQLWVVIPGALKTRQLWVVILAFSSQILRKCFLTSRYCVKIGLTNCDLNVSKWKNILLSMNGSVWTVPQMSIIIIYNSTWSYLIQ